MRFWGGGIGHIYMRQVEPWLDGTGWGTSWPSLRCQDPDPDSEPVALTVRELERGGDYPVRPRGNPRPQGVLQSIIFYL